MNDQNGMCMSNVLLDSSYCITSCYRLRPWLAANIPNADGCLINKLRSKCSALIQFLLCIQLVLFITLITFWNHDPKITANKKIICQVNRNITCCCGVAANSSINFCSDCEIKKKRSFLDMITVAWTFYMFHKFHQKVKNTETKNLVKLNFVKSLFYETIECMQRIGSIVYWESICQWLWGQMRSQDLIE